MRYEQPEPLGKAEAAELLASENRESICAALTSLALHEEDWKWVQDTAVHFLDHPEAEVRMVAATALGHLARLHGQLELDSVVPAVRTLLKDPRTVGRAADALEDISIFARKPQS